MLFYLYEGMYTKIIVPNYFNAMQHVVVQNNLGLQINVSPMLASTKFCIFGPIHINIKH